MYIAAASGVSVAGEAWRARVLAPVAPRRHHGSRAVAARRRRLRRVHVGLLLGLRDVLLVADSFVSEPVIDLQRKIQFVTS